jgi:transcriptional regulator with XRE-family HTH domain
MEKGITIPGTDEELLRQLMKKHHLSIAAIADYLKVDQRSVYRILQGQPSSHQLKETLIILYLKVVLGENHEIPQSIS